MTANRQQTPVTTTYRTANMLKTLQKQANMPVTTLHKIHVTELA